MNWYFHAIARPNSLKELINEYSYLLERGLEEFIDAAPLTEKQEEAWITEYPSGGDFVHDWSYRYTFSCGWYDKKYGYVKMGPIPYDIKVERADPGVYASEVNLEFPIKNRVRFIDNAEPII